MSAGVVRIIVMVVCAAGVAGMIVTSVLGHNGAALTFGLITAVAVLCMMVATAVTTTPGLAGLSPSGVPSGPTTTRRGPAVPSSTAAVPGPAAVPAPGAEAEAEEQAALVEAAIATLVAAGAVEADVRDLARRAVRLGRLNSVPGP
jgi:hypothetical protein